MDIEYLLLLQNFREASSGVLDNFFMVVTSLGGSTAMILIAMLVYCMNKKLGSYLIFNGLMGSLLNGFLKISFCVYRPWMRDLRVVPVAKAMPGATGYSFPSGHACIATAVWGGLAYKERKRKWLSFGCCVVWFLVLFSRNYLGVHTPQDVIVSTMVGMLLLWFTTKLEQALEKNPRLDAVVAGIIFATGLLLMIYASCKTYPLDMVDGKYLADPEVMVIDSFAAAGAAIGFAFGWLLERRKIHFEMKDSTKYRGLYFVASIISMLLVKELTKKIAFLFLADRYAKAVEMGVVVFWLIGMMPLLAKLLKKVTAR